MHRSLSALVLSASVAFSGCYSTYIIPKQELSHLDGYDIHKLKTITTVGLGTAQGSGSTSLISDQPHRVVSADGTAIDFGSKTLLGLALTDNSLRTGNYAEIHFSPSAFEGKLLNGLPVSVGLEKINHAELTVFDAGKTQTAWLIVGTVLLTGALVGLAAARASTPCYYCY